MNLLAIDSCSNSCSVSLYSNKTKTSRFLANISKSSGLILQLLSEVLAVANIKTADLDAIIYTKGPGAFTGVRLCVSVAQGMSLSHNIATLGFSTLELIAYGACKKYHINKVAVALDARMGEVYWGVYRQQKLQSESLKKPNKVDILGNDFFGVGSGWGFYAAELTKNSLIDNYETNFYPKASYLIDLAIIYYDAHGSFSYDLPLPVYLRNNVAVKSLK